MTANPVHIVVVEDDPDMRELVVESLEMHGFRVTGAENGVSLEQIVKSDPANLVVIDLGLPDADGMSLARKVREESNAGVVIVTGRGGDIDRVLGLELGADDYIVKPFLPRELVARVQVVLRRSGSSTYPSSVPRANDAHPVYEFDGWSLDCGTRSIRTPDDAFIDVTSSEFELLCALLEAPGRVRTREYLSRRIFSRDWSPVDRAVDGLVSRLRKKMVDSGFSVDRIKSLRGTGYTWAGKVRV